MKPNVVIETPEREKAKLLGAEFLYQFDERAGLMMSDGMDVQSADRIAWEQLLENHKPKSL